MNKAKYVGVPHPVRETNDLKDIVTYSCEHFADTAAYLQKDRPGGTSPLITLTWDTFPEASGRRKAT